MESASQTKEDGKEAELMHIYHNQGMEHYKEKDFKNAVVFFSKALNLNSRVIESCFNRGLAYARLDDYDKALMDFSSVIRLSPNIHEAYYVRGLVYENKGEYDNALKEYAKALKVNPDYFKAYGRLMKTYLKLLKFEINRKSDFLDWLEFKQSQIRNSRHRWLILNKKRDLEYLINEIDRPSCHLNDGAICCHFLREMWMHSVVIESRKLPLIEDFLRKQGKQPEDHLMKVGLKELKEEERKKYLGEKKEYVVARDGVEYIFCPKRNLDRKAPKEPAETVPMTLSGNVVGFSGKDAYACGFLNDGFCVLHDIGPEGDRGLDVCRSWICLTGYAIKILLYFNVLNFNDIDTRSLADLNKIAEKGLRLTVDRVIQNKELQLLDQLGEKALRDIVNPPRPEMVSTRHTAYFIISGRYHRLLSEQVRGIRRELLTDRALRTS